MKSAIDLIIQERKEQLDKHKYSHDHDITNNCAGELPLAAEMLLASLHQEGIDPESYPYGWNHDVCANMLAKPYLDKLVVAAALIVAEIERQQNVDADSRHLKILENAKLNEFKQHGELTYIPVASVSDLDRVSMMCDEDFRYTNLQTRIGREKNEYFISQRALFAFHLNKGVLTWFVSLAPKVNQEVPHG